ncbi:unnamed protein product [Closterium sp. NIES-64]|nr:unnamed protein product [Closterium sp. NIES-64]
MWLKRVFIVRVKSAADFAARASLPPTATVILHLQKDLMLPKVVLFGRQQSCTILILAKWPGYTVTGGNPMSGKGGQGSGRAGQGVAELGKEWQSWARSGRAGQGVAELGKGVAELGKEWRAPRRTRLLHMAPSLAQFTCTVFGPVGVQWSMAMPRAAGLTNAHWSVFSLFFSSHTSSQAPACLQATPYPVYLSPPQGNIFGRVDVLRRVNTPVVLHRGAEGIAVTSIYIHDHWRVNTPILLHRRAVGVTVRNNYVHHFIFAGIKCGADVHYSFACMLSRINSNLVVSSGRNLNGDHDSAGIYFYTHWFSPGNSALCNYVFNGDHCYYLDHCTSGVLVRGGACVNTYDGMKVNNGKRNVIKNVVMKGTRRSLGWTSCFTVTVNNCLKDPGNYSEAMRVKYYNSARINHLWPSMKDVCKETSANGGVSCNPPGQPGADVTGACSGLETDNLIDVVAVNTTNYGLDWKHCENFTSPYPNFLLWHQALPRPVPQLTPGKFNPRGLIGMAELVRSAVRSTAGITAPAGR